MIGKAQTGAEILAHTSSKPPVIGVVVAGSKSPPVQMPKQIQSPPVQMSKQIQMQVATQGNGSEQYYESINVAREDNRQGVTMFESQVEFSSVQPNFVQEKSVTTSLIAHPSPSRRPRIGLGLQFPVPRTGQSNIGGIVDLPPREPWINPAKLAMMPRNLITQDRIAVPVLTKVPEIHTDIYSPAYNSVMVQAAPQPAPIVAKVVGPPQQLRESLPLMGSNVTAVANVPMPAAPRPMPFPIRSQSPPPFVDSRLVQQRPIDIRASMGPIMQHQTFTQGPSLNSSTVVQTGMRNTSYVSPRVSYTFNQAVQPVLVKKTDVYVSPRASHTHYAPLSQTVPTAVYPAPGPRSPRMSQTIVTGPAPVPGPRSPRISHTIIGAPLPNIAPHPPNVVVRQPIPAPQAIPTQIVRPAQIQQQTGMLNHTLVQSMIEPGPSFNVQQQQYEQQYRQNQQYGQQNQPYGQQFQPHRYHDQYNQQSDHHHQQTGGIKIPGANAEHYGRLSKPGVTGGSLRNIPTGTGSQRAIPTSNNQKVYEELSKTEGVRRSNYQYFPTVGNHALTGSPNPLSSPDYAKNYKTKHGDINGANMPGFIRAEEIKEGGLTLQQEQAFADLREALEDPRGKESSTSVLKHQFKETDATTHGPLHRRIPEPDYIKEYRQHYNNHELVQDGLANYPYVNPGENPSFWSNTNLTGSHFNLYQPNYGNYGRGINQVMQRGSI